LEDDNSCTFTLPIWSTAKADATCLQDLLTNHANASGNAAIDAKLALDTHTREAWARARHSATVVGTLADSTYTFVMHNGLLKGGSRACWAALGTFSSIYRTGFKLLMLQGADVAEDVATDLNSVRYTSTSHKGLRAMAGFLLELFGGNSLSFKSTSSLLRAVVARMGDTTSKIKHSVDALADNKDSLVSYLTDNSRNNLVCGCYFVLHMHRVYQTLLVLAYVGIMGLKNSGKSTLCSLLCPTARVDAGIGHHGTYQPRVLPLANSDASILDFPATDGEANPVDFVDWSAAEHVTTSTLVLLPYGMLERDVDIGIQPLIPLVRRVLCKKRPDGTSLPFLILANGCDVLFNQYCTDFHSANERNVALQKKLAQLKHHLANTICDQLYSAGVDKQALPPTRKQCFDLLCEKTRFGNMQLYANNTPEERVALHALVEKKESQMKEAGLVTFQEVRKVIFDWVPN